jgi:hypothetical protein
MKTENKIPEGNIVLAQFMGGKLLSTEPYEMPHGSRSEGELESWSRLEGMNSDMSRLGIFEYDSSWSWIHPVIDKIESLGYEVTLSRRGVQIWKYRSYRGLTEATDLIIDEDFLDDYVGAQKLISVWDSCVSFVLYYNKHNSTKI